MDKKTIYLETSVVSYLANRPSRDLIVAAHQTVTREWWERRRLDFTLFVSEPVLDEAGGGDPDAAAQRLTVVDDIDVLQVTDAAIDLAERLLRSGAIPKEAAIDALHVALACVNGIHYSLSSDVELQAHCQRRTFRGNSSCLYRERLQAPHYLHAR